MKIVIIYHSGFGHTKVVAERIAQGSKRILPDVLLFTIKEASEQFSVLQQADTIVFGSPTYFGTVSAEFKQFMERTASTWAKQGWKNKLAAGFTNSSSTNGDKLSTLITIALFAAQHSMIWIPLGLMPKYDDDGKQLPEHNGMASYLGLMTLSDNAHDRFNEPSDLVSAELFGERIATLTKQVKSNSLQLVSELNTNN
jgi:NAD(P)H dehydrogenase (quinone)